jgi:hypothetical protein
MTKALQMGGQGRVLGKDALRQQRPSSRLVACLAIGRREDYGELERLAIWSRGAHEHR